MYLPISAAANKVFNPPTRWRRQLTLNRFFLLFKFFFFFLLFDWFWLMNNQWRKSGKKKRRFEQFWLTSCLASRCDSISLSIITPFLRSKIPVADRLFKQHVIRIILMNFNDSIETLSEFFLFFCFFTIISFFIAVCFLLFHGENISVFLENIDRTCLFPGKTKNKKIWKMKRKKTEFSSKTWNNKINVHG